MITAIESSPRKKGNSHTMLQAVLAGAHEVGTITNEVHLRDLKYDPCVGCEACRKAKACTMFDDGMTTLYPLIEESKGLVLISPVHNYNVTAWMKAFIDRMYCYYDFTDSRPRGWSSRLAGQGRKAVIGAIAEQANKKDMGFTLDAMRMPLEALGYEVISEISVLRLFDKGIIVNHANIMEEARLAGKNLAEAL
ncbi:Multimeric flavodoxin WrbA [Maridesulfovibrio ferrireducens]|uniref:Multimeric flavodoxin WrbA n=1 Tax=Maridesulfovibrio ferrireducens TaxID=246191 RepID=A0A1G9B1X2_9BACT|nr:flavodoxin family protein [Maridesulfovibrio ferrireducens]SDK33596.1 Multimeric flavodoxin WrbA [Maridesulfovibrio ferrireducens]